MTCNVKYETIEKKEISKLKKKIIIGSLGSPQKSNFQCHLENIRFTKEAVSSDVAPLSPSGAGAGSSAWPASAFVFAFALAAAAACCCATGGIKRCS